MQMTQDKDPAREPSPMTEEEAWYYKFGDNVSAAFQTGAAHRWIRGGNKDISELNRPTGQTRGIVGAYVHKLERGDLRGFKEVFAAQAVELDEIFSQYGRMAAANAFDFETFMRIALKAQWQCRWTLKALLAVNVPRSSRARIARSQSRRRAQSRKKILRQTIENGKPPA
jgi:hypothetical protein